MVPGKKGQLLVPWNRGENQKALSLTQTPWGKGRREDYVPQKDINAMFDRVDIPSCDEAHLVKYVVG